MELLDIINQVLGTSYENEDSAQEDLIQKEFLLKFHHADNDFVHIYKALTGMDAPLHLVNNTTRMLVEARNYANVIRQNQMLFAPLDRILSNFGDTMTGMHKNFIKNSLKHYDNKISKRPNIDIKKNYRSYILRKVEKKKDEILSYGHYVNDKILTYKARKLVETLKEEEFTIPIGHNGVDLSVTLPVSYILPFICTLAVYNRQGFREEISDDQLTILRRILVNKTADEDHRTLMGYMNKEYDVDKEYEEVQKLVPVVLDFYKLKLNKLLLPELDKMKKNLLPYLGVGVTTGDLRILNKVAFMWLTLKIIRRQELLM